MNSPPSYEEAVNNENRRSNRRRSNARSSNDCLAVLFLIALIIFLPYFMYYLFYHNDICYERYVAENNRHSVLLPKNSLMCHLSNPINSIYIVRNFLEILFQTLNSSILDISTEMNRNMNNTR